MKKYRHKIYTTNIAVTCEMVNDNYEIVKGGIIHRVPNWIIENSKDWELIPNIEDGKVITYTVE